MPLNLPSRILFVPSTSAAAVTLPTLDEILGVMSAPAVHTGTTNLTFLNSFTIPLARLRFPCILDIEYHLSATNNANTKTVQVRLSDGTNTVAVTVNTSLTSNVGVRQGKQVVLLSPTQVSYSGGSNAGNPGSTAVAWTTDTTLNITGNLTVAITMTLANATDTVTLHTATLKQYSAIAPPTS